MKGPRRGSNARRRRRVRNQSRQFAASIARRTAATVVHRPARRSCGSRASSCAPESSSRASAAACTAARYHGFSVEFSEYRQYTPGDDPRYLDWRLFARTDRYYIKRFEDETNLRCHLLVDLSRSMGYGSLGYTKVDYARTAAATLAYFLSTQRDAVGLVTFDEQIAEYLPAALPARAICTG